MNRSILAYLESIVGRDHVSESIFEKIKNALDTFPYGPDKEALPYCVVLPETREQLSEIMKYANRENIPVFVRGSGTQLAGSSRPHISGIVISTHLMDKFEIFEGFGFFESEPGVTVREATEILAAKGYLLPILPGSRLIASMGGVVSNNTSGHIVDAALGKLGDYVLGLEVVLPTGEILETGTKGLRKPAGTDLTKLFVGGDGLLGIVTKIRMRLIPLVKQAYGIAVYDDLDSIAKGVKRMYLEHCPPPLFMEFMDRKVAEIAYKIKEMEPPPGPVIFFVGMGRDIDDAQAKMAVIMECFLKENPIDARAITDMEEWTKLWTAREVIAPYLMQETGGKLLLAEVVANLAQLAECMKDAESYNKGVPVLEELENYLFGHIGALTMHPTHIVPSTWDDQKSRKAVKENFRKEMELNLKYGTCGGEWGQFSKRMPFFLRRYGETAYNLVKGTKSVFDPRNILNPGILEGYR
jgi:glycolate oxidase